MSFLETVKGKIGSELYSRLEKEAEKEVAAAIRMPLKDQYKQDQYYRPKFFQLANLLNECQCFEDLGLKISPADVISILFKCKLLFVAQSEDEYMKRIGGGMHNFGLWREKSAGTIDVVVNRHFDRLPDLTFWTAIWLNPSQWTYAKFYEAYCQGQRLSVFHLRQKSSPASRRATQ